MLHFGVPAAAEQDRGFQEIIARLNRWSLYLVGMVGVLAPLLFVLAQIFISGKDPAWTYGGTIDGTVVVIWDKLMIFLLGLALLLLSPSTVGRRHGRRLVAIMMLAAGVAIISDDLANANLSFTAAWLALMVVVASTMPFRPWHILAVGLALTAMLPLMHQFVPDFFGWRIARFNYDHIFYVMMATLAGTGICGMLYAHRYRQHLAVRREEEINGELDKAHQQLMQAVRLASLGNLTQALVHELESPLASLKSESDPAARQTAIVRIETLVDRLSSFASQTDTTTETIDLGQMLSHSLAMFSRDHFRHISLVTDFEEEVFVGGYPAQLGQLFLQLLINSAAAIKGEGSITVKLLREEDSARVIIVDDGEGIPTDAHGRLFDPGFTTRAELGASGLGLTICYRIVDKHNGSIEIDSTEGNGTSVSIWLPLPNETTTNTDQPSD